MTERKYKVLIVEDDTSMRSILVREFTHVGFSVIEAKNGEEGLHTALKKKPDVLLLDILMPKMDGMTMLKKLRDDPWGAHVPAIILSNVEPSSESMVRDVATTEPTYYLIKTEQNLSAIVQTVRDALHATEIA